MTAEEFEQLEIAIKKITKQIFKTYQSLAELEIKNQKADARYQGLKEELQLYKTLEARLYQKMIQNPYFLEKYYEKVYEKPEYQMDVWLYMVTGKSDCLYYDRIPRQLESMIHFQKERMELSNGYGVTGSLEQREQFTYTMYALVNSLDQEISYKRLKMVEDYLENEALTGEEIEYFTRLKYYYIFINSRAEGMYLNGKGKFKVEEKSLTLYLLEKSKTQLEVFSDCYNARFHEEIRNRLSPVMEHLCSYPNENFKDRQAMDLFLTIELESILSLLDQESLEEVIGLALYTVQNLRSSDNILGRFYGFKKIEESVDKYQEKEYQKRKNQ